ncbi:hypothetical protein OROHE_001082 [Orobanche hederae]
MACSAATSMTIVFLLIPKLAFIPEIPSPLNLSPLLPHSPRNRSRPVSAAPSTPALIPPNDVVYRLCFSELPLVGNTTPDFEAEAIFDQEFIKVPNFSCGCETLENQAID